MNNYCVYKHIAPDGRIYIGITSQKPKARWQSGNGYKGNSYFTRAIEKYGWHNFSHTIIADRLSEDAAKSIEICLISSYRSNNRKYGFNISSGGESKKGTKISDWQKQRIIQANKEKIVSPATRKKLSEASLRTWKDPKFKEHMRAVNLGENNPQYGKIRTDEERKLRGAKPVLQFNMEGEFLAEYISCHVASDMTKISRDVISKCCRGIFKQGGGYLWRYK